jgi:hypothetical protein
MNYTVSSIIAVYCISTYLKGWLVRVTMSSRAHILSSASSSSTIWPVTTTLITIELVAKCWLYTHCSTVQISPVTRVTRRSFWKAIIALVLHKVCRIAVCVHHEAMLKHNPVSASRAVHDLTWNPLHGDANTIAAISQCMLQLASLHKTVQTL